MKLLTALVGLLMALSVGRASSQDMTVAGLDTSYVSACTGPTEKTDVIAWRTLADGTYVEFQRNDEDIARLVNYIREDVANDPRIREREGWSDEFLKPQHWAQDRPCAKRDNRCSGSCKTQGHTCQSVDTRGMSGSCDCLPPRR